VVDDDLDLLFVMQKTLQSGGYHVSTLSDGKMVMHTIELSAPDLIILDINLGDTDGREICEKIKHTHGFTHIPVILYSAGHRMDTTAADCEAAAFIKKPFSKSYILEKVGEFIPR
jgi:DNA-binding response OmpR family regulator